LTHLFTSWIACPILVADEIKERVEPFVRKLRAAHPATPIVLVEDRTMQDSFLIVGA